MLQLFKKPILCNYYLTYRCNASCSFCDIWEKPSPYVKVKDFISNLVAIKKLGVKIIDFTGGEPLLHPHLPDLLKIAKNLGFITVVTTNCLLYPKRARFLIGKVDKLQFSIDSSDPEKHNANRGVECYDFIIKSINIAKKNNERPELLFTLHDENIHEINKIYSLSQKYNLILLLNPIFSYNSINFSLSKKHDLLLKEWAKKPGVYINQALLLLRKNGGNNILKPVCKAASKCIVISPFNELVLPCYHLGIEKIPIENNLHELWKSPKIQSLIKLEGKLPGCQGCTINCYMQPSFTFQFNQYGLKTWHANTKYFFDRISIETYKSHDY